VWFEGVEVGYDGVDYIIVHERVFPPLHILRRLMFHVLFTIYAMATTSSAEDVLAALERVLSTES
jgi:hypothetical protein